MPDAMMTLEFDGPAVDSGVMDVRQLAPALIANADVIRSAHALLNVQGPPPQVNISATRQGSFVIELLVADAPLGRQFLDLLLSRPVDGTVNLGGLVSLVVSTFSGVCWLRNRKIKRTEQVDSDVIRIVIDENTTLEIRAEAFRLIMDAQYREALREAVQPLAGDQGIERMKVSTDGQAATIMAANVPAFDVPPSAEVQLGEATSEVVLRLVNVAFNEGNKWRLSDGEATFYASIYDVAFLSAVDAGRESFSKNDMLRVRLRTHQTRNAEGLHTEYIVTEVLEHTKGGMQLDLFADVGGDRPDPPSGSASAP
jgi:hypothetical protein